jgi:hypothetical protein
LRTHNLILFYFIKGFREKVTESGKDRTASRKTLPPLFPPSPQPRRCRAPWKNLISGTKQEDLRLALAIVEAEKMRIGRAAAPAF